MDNRKKILGIVLLAAVVGLVVWLLVGNRDGGSNSVYFFSADEDPRGYAIDFYEFWLEAVNSTTTNPYSAGLTKVSILTPELQSKLAASKGKAFDPVLCQETIPGRIRTRVVFELDTTAQILVTYPSDDLAVQPIQSLVAFERGEGGWKISDITCSAGESEEVGEYSFEREGNLLKSVPAPLNPDYWHLVYEENGQKGNAAPLFFTENSVCIELDGKEKVCDTTTFVEAQKVSVKADMTESGAEVKRLQFIK